MRRFGRWTCALLAMLAVSGCGAGEGASSSGGTPTPPGTPTPSPTPSILPLDFTTDFNLSSNLGYEVVVFAPLGDGAEHNFGTNILEEDRSTALNYEASPVGFTARYSALSFSFTEADQQEAGGGWRVYRTAEASAVLGYNPSLPQPRYVVPFSLKRDIGQHAENGVSGTLRHILAGFVGQQTSRPNPVPSVMGYGGTFIVYGGSRGDYLWPSFGISNFTFNHYDKTFLSDLQFTERVGGSSFFLKMRGTFDESTGSLSGTLYDDENRFSGTVRGQAFGPGWAEIVILQRFTRASDGAQFVGEFIGTLNHYP